MLSPQFKIFCDVDQIITSLFNLWITDKIKVDFQLIKANELKPFNQISVQ